MFHLSPKYSWFDSVINLLDNPKVNRHIFYMRNLLLLIQYLLGYIFYRPFCLKTIFFYDYGADGVGVNVGVTVGLGVCVFEGVGVFVAEIGGNTP